jgi:hypothetical protein
MTYHDLNDAPEQTTFALLPPGIYRLEVAVKPGGVGDGGFLTLARNLRTCHLNLEFTVVGGEHGDRKIWDILTVEVDESDSDLLPSIDAAQLDKFHTAVSIGRSRLRALIESANGIAGNDSSDTARQLRQISLAALNGLRPLAKVGIKKGTNGYADKNNIVYFVTAEMREWPKQQPASSSRPVTPLPPPPTEREEFNDSIPF